MTKTIHLLAPVEWHGKSVSSFELREPTGGQYLKHGEPRILTQSGDAMYWVENRAAIKAYAEGCIGHEGGADLLGLLSLSDIRQVKDGILGFFTAADRAISAARSTGSSSTSD